MRVLGFLDKNAPRDAARLSEAYARAHLMLVPSRADCTLMVVAEAMAWGVLVFGADVGEIAGQIGAGAGRVLEASTGPQAWADEIEAMMGSRTLYEMMADAAFDRARTDLSWEVWSAGIESALREPLATRAVAPLPALRAVSG